MERKLINYLPYVVREFAEFQGIATGEQPEFELAWNSTQEVFDNQFIDTALDYGLKRWEKMLGIFPKGTDTLETRRAVVLSRMVGQIPFTYRVLQRMLDALYGPDTAHCFLSQNSYLVGIKIKWEKPELLPKLRTMLDAVLPANLLYSFTYIMFPEVIENRHRFSFARQLIRGRFPHNAHQMGVTKLLFGWVAAPTITNRAKFLARLPTKTEEAFSLPRLLLGPYTVDVMGLEAARFDGVHHFDGQRFFWYTFKRRPAFQSMNILSGAANRERASGSMLLNPKGAAGNRALGVLRGRYRARDSTRSIPGHTGTTVGAKIKNINTVTACFTADSMWRFDGAYTFGGERRFNAKIERSEL